MTTFMFATCDTDMALRHLRGHYPSRIIDRDNKYVAEVLRYVEADKIRIPDPVFHPNGAVMPSKNWNPSEKETIVDALTTMVSNLPKKEGKS